MTEEKVHVWRSENGFWSGSTASVPGYVARAQTEQDARRKVRDAINAYAASMKLADTSAPSAGPSLYPEDVAGLIPVYFGSPDLRLFDPAIPEGSPGWAPADQVSLNLYRCVEGLRDIAVDFELMKQVGLALRGKRKVKALATPLYNFASALRDLFSFLVGDKGTAEKLGASLRKTVCTRKLQYERRVPLGRAGALRIVRDKMAAHLDEEPVASPARFWAKVDMPQCLRWVKESLKEMVYLVGLDVYVWTRESGHPKLRSIMFSDGILTNLLVEDGHARGILNVMLARSPKYGISEEIKSVVSAWNHLARGYGMDGELIAWRDRRPGA